jgi:hypothetical protein
MRVSLFTCLLLAVAALSPASAHDSAPAAVRHPLVAWRPVAWRPAPAPALSAGMRVELDPATGELVAPGATRLPLATAVRAAREAGLTVVTRADGSRSVVVGDRLRKWSVARVGADGTLEQECVHSEAEAIARVRAASAPAAKGGR